ncbi:hypothetical protein H920_04799 [Fukomys damarensis]|uniref:Uncharacterized protein n=1 Tax=Fukomys damarensis TaxID=885580 RepID=A0A091DU67_FUKDA|nr:hypothetical protein H920_04799 [Fukomys damarensis]
MGMVAAGMEDVGCTPIMLVQTNGEIGRNDCEGTAEPPDAPETMLSQEESHAFLIGQQLSSIHCKAAGLADAPASGHLALLWAMQHGPHSNPSWPLLTT